MKRLHRLVPSLVVLLLSCGVDRIRTVSCPATVLETTTETTTMTSTTTSKQSDFDITQVSTQEATDNLPGGSDAVILDHDASQLPPNSTWRVGSVDVLVTVPSADFSGYPSSVGLGSVSLTVQVWDANTPTNPQKPAYQLRQVLNPSALTWTSVSLPSGSFKRAWWTFDFAPLIPTTGMSAPQFLVGVKWDSTGEPQLGYSNFNRPCARNWTIDLSQGSQWQLNSTSTTTGANECSWPMLRVNTETVTEVTTTTEVPVTREVQVMVEREFCDYTVREYIDGGVTSADAGSP